MSAAVLSINPTMKMCSVCGETQPIEFFHRRRHYSKDGHRAACKACTSKLSKAAREARGATQSDEDRKKAQVRYKTRRLIQSGELVPRPCRVCKGLEVQAHHPEYDHPEAHRRVKWLCVLHHAQEHGVRDWTKQMELFPEPPTTGGGSTVTYRAVPE